MAQLKFLLEKEFKQIIRDKFILRLTLMLPLIQLLILPLAANFEMRNINISVVDNDHSTYSQRLRDKITASGYFRLTQYAPSYNQALRDIEQDRADVVLEIPRAFERDLMREGKAQLSVAANAVNGTKGGLSVSYLGGIIQDFNTEILQEQGAALATLTAPVTVQTLHRYNPHLDYKRYMVPGIIVFLLTILGGFLSALNIVGEKEKGTMEQMNVSPVARGTFILAKVIPFWVMGVVVLTIGLGVAWLVYGLVPVGSIGLVYLFAVIYLMAATGMGMIISNYSATGQQAMFVSFFFLIIFGLLSGLFTPIGSMPQWAQCITGFNPMRYFVEVMRMIYLKGSTLVDMQGHLLAICLFAVAFNTWAVWSYRKRD